MGLLQEALTLFHPYYLVNIVLGASFVALRTLSPLCYYEPTYKGPEKVTYFSKDTLEEEMASDKDITWVVCFYASWSPACVQFAPLFSQLSVEYGTPYLRFGKLDATRFRDTALRFSVSDHAYSKQLPTVVVFQHGGTEMCRVPTLSSSGRVNRVPMTRDVVIKGLAMDDLKEDALKLEKKKGKKKEN
ncbi:unnamed protein product [Cyprideis torosa]|uniref:Uncharacterized protein n=1 Tax=Cyprideis torosa TaxID=163714 RepID=A0A7R8W5R2_9CRUS|nr:unnamed protein product [Cyprideis torosa]CAG0880128.1 unnamed protein product [Cyprideis torosa]